MSSFKFRKPSPAMVVALTALFVVLGGSAVAASRLLIHTKNIANGAVTNRKLANGAVGFAKLNTPVRRALASAGQPRGVVNGPQGPKGDSGGQGSKGDSGGLGSKGDTGSQGPSASLPLAITTLGTTYGPNTFQAAAYGDNSLTPETCAPAPKGRGGDPANVSNGTIAFATPPSAPPLGSKALEMADANGRSVVTYLPQDGCKSNQLLSQLTDVAYSSLVTARNPSDSGGNTDIDFQVEMTRASTASGTSGYTTMVYEPYQNGQANATTWTMHNVAAGKVWSTHSLTSGNCTQGTPCPYSTFLSENPNAQILDMKFRIGQNSGAGWSGFDGYVDNVWLNFARYDLGG